MNDQIQLKQLPSVDRALGHAEIRRLAEQHGHDLVVYALRHTIEILRRTILAGNAVDASLEQVVSKTARFAEDLCRPSLKPVVNATGIILHTNLGRAPLGEAVAREVQATLGGYSNLEFDLQRGARGKRSDHLTELLRFLTGAEDAVVVNNDAAAVALTIGTLANGREVLISRGELVEIGDGFRIPEIITAAGGKMVEVGTTNRTHLADYERAISAETAMIFRAHKSNFAVKGFAEEPPLSKLAELAHSKGLPLVYDLGSGLLYPHPRLSAHAEPDVRTALAAGADLVMFSCDKLLGGAQGGVVVGRKELISRLAKAPLMRALRVGKLVLSALSASCRQYLQPQTLGASNPFFFFLERTPEELQLLANKLQTSFEERQIGARVVESIGQCGGGSMPELELKSYAVSLELPEHWSAPKDVFAEQIFHRLLRQDPALLGVLRKGELLFDVLTLRQEQLQDVAAAVASALQRTGNP